MQSADKSNCMICLSVALDPVECSTCRQRFCMKCANKWTKQAAVCPKKCSNFWRYQRVYAEAPQMKCLYSEHQGAMFNPSTFETHLKQCPNRPSEVKFQQQLSSKNVCDKGHTLSLYKADYLSMIKGKCCHCKNEDLCRLICKTCSEIYCISCRPVQFGKALCPYGKHPFKKIVHIALLCDNCGIKPSHMNSYGYIDMECDLGLCRDCFVGICGQYNETSEIEKEKVKNNSTPAAG